MGGFSVWPVWRQKNVKFVPSNHLKFFFKCSLTIAARRRFKEFRKTNKKITLKEVESAIRRRNYTDVTRTFMPLRIPPGAVIVSTSSISKKEIGGLVKTFPLYARLPRSYWKDIKIAESDTPEAKKVYSNLLNKFREQYSNISLARD